MKRWSLGVGLKLDIFRSFGF